MLGKYLIPSILFAAMSSLAYITWQLTTTPTPLPPEENMHFQLLPRGTSTRPHLFVPTTVPIVDDVSKEIPKVTEKNQDSCPSPYKMKLTDGRCVFSCGVGTRADITTNTCSCYQGFVEVGKDAAGRITCAIPQPKSFTISWNTPIQSSLTVARGGEIPIEWNIQGGDERSGVAINLSNATTDYSDGIYVKAQLKRAVMPVNVPPGQYELRITQPVGVSRVIQVTVTGAPQAVSATQSSIEFDNSALGETSYTISASGHCAADLTATVLDDFGMEMRNKRVILQSSRGNADTISPGGLSTDEYGEMTFKVLSETAGDTTLEAFVEGIRIGTLLTLHVVNSPDACDY